jgi:hypothetical protein
MSIGYLSSNGMNTVFSQWADADPNINQYGYGQLYNENGEPKAKQKYPGVWINPVQTNVNLYNLIRTYQVLIYDVTYDDGTPEVTNQNKVISDCEEIAFRLVRFLRDKSDIFDITGTPTITPFTDRFLDDVSGVILNVDIEFNAESSYCEDPDYNSFNIKNNEI